MSDELTTEESESQGGASRCRPPFPIFPIVFPMTFPIGFMIVMGRTRKRRRRALESRLSQVEERLDDLEAKVSSD